MSEDNPQGITVVSFPIITAFTTPISNLSSIMSTISETCVILGTPDQINFQNLSNSLQISAYPYQSGSSRIRQMLRYNALQIRIISRLFSLRREYRKIIFFMEFPPVLPMIFGKIFQYRVYWLLPSKISLSSDSILSKVTITLSKICYNLCNNIILYSPSLVSYWSLEKYCHKVLIAHRHFLDFEVFTVTTPLASRHPLIGYIGRLSGEKGIQHFTQALPTIFGNQQDLRVFIGGDGQLKEMIEASLQEEGLTTRVDFPGWISHDDLPKYLNQLRLLVLPSYTEGLPNIMLEAMACGTPVLATPVGAIPDVIVDGRTGFIMENNSPECIVVNVIRALNSPGLEQIAENGRHFVEEHFTFERVVARWTEVLEEI